MTDTATIKQLQQNSVFISNTYKKALIPCLFSILSSNINVIIDGILVGQKLGAAALAAIYLCVPINLLLCVIGSLFSAGTSINASKELGTTTKDRANDYYRADIIFSYIISVIVTLVGAGFVNSISRLVCTNNDAYPFVRDYLLIILIGSIFRIMIYIPFWFLRLEGKNKDIMSMMIIMTIINIILDVLFIFIMNMGVFGAGLANVISTAFAMGYGFLRLHTEDSNFYFEFKLGLKNVSIKKVVIDGIPTSVNNLCCAIRLFIVNGMLLAYGGTSLVAVFTAVFGMFCIGECIILGIPQASIAMLGVYSGERDNASCKLIIKTELKIGALLSTIFVIISVVLAPFISNVYKLNDNLFIPILLMALSIFPAVITQALSGYYNIEGKNILSNLILVLKLVVFVYVGIILSIKFNIPVFAFFLIAEIFTIVFIYIYTFFYTRIHKDVDRYLLCKMNNEREGKVINFTVENDNEKICDASERISDFCQNNGLNIKDTTKIQLAIEEALVLVSDVNNNVNEELSGFDLRVFVYEEVSGIRIRYDGLDFNPFEGNMEGSDYMGIRMVSELLETTIYKRTFGVNTLILLLKEFN